MKKSQVSIGKTYLVKVSGKLAPVKIICESPHGGWEGRNVTTGRDVRIRGAARLRGEYPTEARRPYLGPVTPPTDLVTPRLNPMARGITLAYTQDWRQREHNAVRDSGMPAFWRAHGLCAACHGRGEVNCGRQEDPACKDCGGTGLVVGK